MRRFLGRKIRFANKTERDRRILLAYDLGYLMGRILTGSRNMPNAKNFLRIWVFVAAVFLLVNTGCQNNRSHKPLVALLTDYGTKDAYVGVLQGAIVSRCRDVSLITMSHEVPDFDIREASFLLGMAADAFPADTVFCVVVDPGVGTSRRSVILQTERGQVFVGPDNGTFSQVVSRQGFRSAWMIDEHEFGRDKALSTTFHGRDIYGPVSGMLAAGCKPGEIGIAVYDLILLPNPKPRRNGKRLVGNIQHIDGYGNLVTTIPADWIPGGAIEDRRSARVSVADVTVTGLFADTYASVSTGDMVLLANSLAVIEVTRNQQSAVRLFPKATTGSEIVMEY